MTGLVVRLTKQNLFRSGYHGLSFFCFRNFVLRALLELSVMPSKIAITSWAISADLFAFTDNINTIIPIVHGIPEDYHYVEAWFIGSKKTLEI